MVVLDWSTSLYKVLVTDENGFYSGDFPRSIGFTPHEYAVYVLHQNAQGIFDFVPAVYPVDVYDAAGRIRDSREVSFVVYPGATVYLSGDIWHVLSRGVPIWHTLEVVDASNLLRPKLGPQSIFTFGDPPFKYWAGPDARFLPEDLFNKSLTVVPAGLPVYVLAKAEFYNDRTARLEIVSFTVDQAGLPFNLSRGELAASSVEAFCARFNVETLKTLTGSVENELTRAESVGFFVGAERQDLGSISKRIEDGELSLPPSNPHPDENTLSDVRFIFLETAYYQIQVLERRIAEMYLLAESHSFFFPFFLAVFTVILAFFLFESDKRKLLTSVGLYPLMAVVLVYVYPGFMVVFKDRVTITVWNPFVLGEFIYFTVPGSLLALADMTLAIAVVLLIFFVFPRMYKEPVVEGRTSIRSILSVIFSMGKRNVKRRRLRSLFSIASMTILVLGFTALTSFSTIYGIVKAGPTIAQVETPGVLLQKIPAEQQDLRYPQQFFTTLEAGSLKDYGAATYAPKAENVPRPLPVISIESLSGEEANIYGVIGVLPSLENRTTHIDRFIVGGQLADNMTRGIVFTRQLADRLGVRVGDTVQVANLSAGISTPLGSFTLVAYLDDAFFSLEDLNGRSFIPNKYVGTDLVKTNETETVLLNWRDALEIGGFVGLSRLFAFVSSPESGIVDFANRMALRGYSTWAYEPGQVTRFYTGTTLEVRGFEQFIIPFIIVVLNVAMVMVTLMYERTREVYLLAMLGLNPAHIASLFLAESIVMALIGGGLGYFLGLGSYRAITFLGLAGQVGVREKLEWYWSVIGVAVAVAAAVSSTIQPAVKAAVLATPSFVRKTRMEEEERREREKDIFRVYGARVFGMPIRVHVKEEPFFSAFIMDALADFTGPHYERVENLAADEEVAPDGTRTKRFSFAYVFIAGEATYSTVNILTARKKPESDYYSLSLSSEPKVRGTPEYAIDETVSLVKDLVMRWNREKKELIRAVQ